jgi:peptide/nickel transport system substrate-binding protein
MTSHNDLSPTARRVSRRQLLRVGLALAALPLAAACGQQQAAPAPTAAPAKPAESKPAESKPAETKPAAPAATSAPAAQPAPAATTAPAAATKPGAGGTLRMLMWQGPTITNPHLSTGTKDYIAARCCLEPLITIAGDGKITPVLAAEVPSKENGGLPADGKSVTYKLKKDIKWADGQPFTAEDVAFTYQFLSTNETTATTVGTYLAVDRVEAVDPLTVKVTFKEPTAGWMVPFAGNNGLVLPKHALGEFIGANARNAPFNLKAFGTGPYVVEDFKPGDLVTYTVNPNYRDAGKLAFNRIEIKGGGDAVSAARAVFETGEFDYSWNLQVEAQVLEQIMRGGKGDLVTAPGSGVEQIYLNQADPNQEIDGERSSPKSKHPFLTDAKVREAMALAIDRDTMAKQLYGPTGDATSNMLTTPTNLASKNTKYEFNIDKANQILDEAGYRRGGDGIRTTPQGVRMKVVYVTSINSLRQKEQALVKDGWQKIGIETELKSVDASIYFSGSPSNPDTLDRFETDVQMFTSTFDSPFPNAYMRRFYAGDLARDWAQKANNWSGRNFSKWSDDQYNKLYEQALIEVDEEKGRQLWIQMNDILINAFVDIPLIDRKFAEGKSKALNGPAPGPFDVVTWNIAEWSKG